MTIFEMLGLLAGLSAVGLFVTLSLIVNGSTKNTNE
jgi:hypothetical protein